MVIQRTNFWAVLKGQTAAMRGTAAAGPPAAVRAVLREKEVPLLATLVALLAVVLCGLLMR